MPKTYSATYIRKTKLWKKRFKINGKSRLEQVSIRQLERGWKKKVCGIQLELEPQNIESNTKEGSQTAANNWVAYCSSMLEQKPVNQQKDRIAKLESELADLQLEMECVSQADFEYHDQALGEMDDLRNELSARRVADQNGIDFDRELGLKRELANVFLSGVPTLPTIVERELFFPELRGKPEPDNALIGFWLQRYLDVAKKERQRSPGTWSNIVRSTTVFADFVGQKKPVSIINEELFERFFLHCKDKFGSSKQTDCLKKARTFINYLYQQRQIDLPRNLTKFQVDSTYKKIEHFTLPELRELLDKSSGFLKCCLHLMANCGFYQIDIATLTPEMLRNGYIVRQRHKKQVGQKGDALPVVSWKLWSKTIELIEEFRTDSNGLVFTRDSGEPWYVDELKGDKHVKRDFIGDQLWQPFKKVTNPRLSMKHIRKTAAQFLQAPPGAFASVDSIETLFLGQSPDSVRTISYTSVPQDEFDQAITQLGKLILNPSVRI